MLYKISVLIINSKGKTNCIYLKEKITDSYYDNLLISYYNLRILKM